MRFLFVDRIVDCVPGRELHARKHVSMESDVFEHHFPGDPIFPGVLIIESVAQAGGLLIEETLSRSGRAVVIVLRSVERAAFLRMVRPGDSLEISVTLDSIDEQAARVRGVVKVDDTTVSRVQLMFGMATAGDEHASIVAQRALMRQRLRAGT